MDAIRLQHSLANGPGTIKKIRTAEHFLKTLRLNR